MSISISVWYLQYVLVSYFFWYSVHVKTFYIRRPCFTFFQFSSHSLESFIDVCLSPHVMMMMLYLLFHPIKLFETKLYLRSMCAITSSVQTYSKLRCHGKAFLQNFFNVSYFEQQRESIALRKGEAAVFSLLLCSTISGVYRIVYTQAQLCMNIPGNFEIAI